MPWDFNPDDIPDQIDGYDVILDGRYHVRVTHVEEAGGKDDSMIVDYEILAGTTPQQESKIFRDYFSRNPKALKRAMLFACAVGLTTAEELEAAKKAGRRVAIDFSRANGRQLVVGLKQETYEGKTRTKCGFDLCAINSPKAAGVPLHQGVIQKAQDEGGDPFGSLSL